MHADLPLHKSTFLTIVGLEHDAFSIRIPARLMLCWQVIEVSVHPQVDPYNGQKGGTPIEGRNHRSTRASDEDVRSRESCAGLKRACHTQCECAACSASGCSRFLHMHVTVHLVDCQGQV